MRHLALDVGDGFTALTGETGAGKSILIDALQLALGGRGDAGVVRPGADKAHISITFEPTGSQAMTVNAWLQEQGFETPDGDNTLLVRRQIDKEGKSRAWINGLPATVAQLKALGDLVVDIHGQQAWAALTRPASVRALLDEYAGVDITPLHQAWQAWQHAQAALTDAQTRVENLQQERERLTWQLRELDKLNPQADEWPELNQQHARLANAQQLIDQAQTALAALQGGEDGSGMAASDAIHAAAQAVAAQVAVEPQFAPLLQQLEDSLAQVQDVAHSLTAYLRRTEPDPDALAQLDSRLSLWVSLARRYKRTPEELPALTADWRDQLTQLDTQLDVDALRAQVERAQAVYQQHAKGVSQQRQTAAPRLAQVVTEAMQSLGLAGGAFDVALPALATPASTGLEGVDFLVAGHAGTAPKPVAKVASGGELSRIALALSVVMQQRGQASTLVFDEVDSGIGGAVAHTVGRLMRQLGGSKQVLAVTHLPQVAACAHTHWQVAKQFDGTSTHSSVTVLDAAARQLEIARMLGGDANSSVSLAHAQEMIASAALSAEHAPHGFANTPVRRKTQAAA